MEIKFDKALLWLVPYLYLVSVAYYWSYWGAFGIDAFNYYPVSDLIKGVTQPVGQTLAIILVIFLFNLITIFFIKILDKKGKKYVLTFFLYLLIIMFIICYFVARWFINHRRFLDVNQSFEYLYAQSAVAVAAIWSAHVIEIVVFQNKRFQFMFENPFRTAIISFFTLLPLQSFLQGKENAWSIIENKEFHYVISDSLVSKTNSFYKYVGKAGDYQVLVTLDNTKKVIIPADKITPLVMEWYSLSDDKSLRNFMNHVKQMQPVNK